ncbi:hypothetical protein C8Q75DRAFT_522010 [Abortiporus biennis]|nr:hypothetical protein C8Q75DRAFT_522010 [Abortiporus biennis]
MGTPAFQLPNPLTPLAWLPPDVADQFEAGRYVLSATFGAWLWDVFMSIPEDIQLFSKRKLSFTDGFYVLSRLFTLGYLVTTLVFQVAQVSHCDALLKIAGAFAAISIPFNTLLFLFRATTVFPHNLPFQTAFYILWTGTLGCAVLMPIDYRGIGSHLGPTRYCFASEPKGTISAPPIAIAVYNSILFLAISVELTSKYGFTEASLFSKEVITRFFRRLLQTGQFYYAVTLILNIGTMVVSLDHTIPPVTRSILVAPNIVLMNAMACRLYRNLKIGLVKDPFTTPSISSTSVPGGSAPIQFGAKSSRGNEIDITLSTDSYPLSSHTNSQKTINVDITTEVEESTDQAFALHTMKSEV